MNTYLYNIILSPSVHTTYSKRMFHFLINKIDPDLVLDIGSRDGKDSLIFRKILPKAKINAFEANPDLYKKCHQIIYLKKII